MRECRSSQEKGDRLDETRDPSFSHRTRQKKMQLKSSSERMALTIFLLQNLSSTLHLWVESIPKDALKITQNSNRLVA